MTQSSEFGKKLIEYREKYGLSQAALARLVGYSRQTVASWETYKSLPRLDVLYDVEKKLGLTIDHETYIADIAKKSSNYEKRMDEQRKLKSILSAAEKYKLNGNVDINAALKNYQQLKEDGLVLKYNGRDLTEEDVAFLFTVTKAYFDNKNKD